MDYLLATTVIRSLALAMVLAVLSQWLVYPFFPEGPGGASAPAPSPGPEPSAWLALRATLIVLPICWP